MKNRAFACAAVWLAVALLAFSSPALAHRVNVFAYVEGDTVHVECSYSRSDRVRFGEIEVKNAANGKVYLTGKTDDKGNFAFTVPPEARADKADLDIVLHAGEGHQNDWTVKASEYLSATPTEPAATSPSSDASGTTGTATSAPATTAAAPVTTMDQAALQAVVEAAVEKKIAPIRNILLSEKEAGPGLTQIVGGIGYLVGLAGLVAYARSRKGGA